MLNDTLPAAVAASPGVDPAAVTTPAALHAYPAEVIAPIVDAYAHALHVVFLAAVPVPLVAFVLALFLKEVPLRGTARDTATDLGEGFGMPEGTDANQQLQLAIARLLRHKGRAGASPGPGAVTRPRSTPPTAGPSARCTCAPGWRGPPTSRRSATATGCLPRCSSPPSTELTRHGYLDQRDEHLLLTEAGEAEMRKIVAALRAWLADELADWGVDDEALTRALGEVATMLVEQDPYQSEEAVLAAR